MILSRSTITYAPRASVSPLGRETGDPLGKIPSQSPPGASGPAEGSTRDTVAARHSPGLAHRPVPAERHRAFIFVLLCYNVPGWSGHWTRPFPSSTW